MAVTKKLLSPKQQFNILQPWKAVFTCGQWSSCKALNRQTDETNSHQCHFKDGEWNIDIDLVPKKLGLQDKDCNRNLGFLSSLARHPALQRAASSSFHFRSSRLSTPWKREEIPWSFRWFGRRKLLVKTERNQRGPGVLAESFTSDWDDA